MRNPSGELRTSASKKRDRSDRRGEKSVLAGIGGLQIFALGGEIERHYKKKQTFTVVKRIVRLQDIALTKKTTFFNRLWPLR